jgi:(p)ppGpp synthase/HD superfamily hydrolase
MKDERILRSSGTVCPQPAGNPSMTVPSRMQQALSMACSVHFDQRRKGTGVPYLTHLLAVSALVGEYGGDEDQMIAALLHDSLEDRPDRVNAAVLTETFGWRVARIVLGCSDCVSHPKPPWEQRKRAYLQSLRAEPPDVKLVSAADKLHNTRALIRDLGASGDAMWLRFNANKDKQCWYLRSCVEVLSDGFSHPILQELEGAVATLQKLCGLG